MENGAILILPGSHSIIALRDIFNPVILWLKSFWKQEHKWMKMPGKIWDQESCYDWCSHLQLCFWICLEVRQRTRSLPSTIWHISTAPLPSSWAMPPASLYPLSHQPVALSMDLLCLTQDPPILRPGRVVPSAAQGPLPHPSNCHFLSFSHFLLPTRSPWHSPYIPAIHFARLTQSSSHGPTGRNQKQTNVYW